MTKEIRTTLEGTKLRNNLKDIKCIHDKGETYMLYKYVGMCDKGITIFIIKHKFISNEVILQINPQTVLGKDGIITLFEIDEENLARCFALVKEILGKYQIDLSDFEVSRMDFTRDIQFEDCEAVDSIIKLLRKTGAPFRYSMTKYGSIEYKDSYDITNKVNSVVVYNKEKQYKQRKGAQNAEFMKGVMRVEVKVAVEDIIYQNGRLYFNNVVKMERYAVQIIKNVFVDGFYIKLERMKSIFYKEYTKKDIGKRERNAINKILELENRIAIHRSLRECIRGKNAYYGYETTQNILNGLKERHINVVTISATENVQVIPDIKYLLGIKSEEEMQEDYEFLEKYRLTDKVPKYHMR